MCSKPNMKNVLSFPLYSPGMPSGPPMVKPGRSEELLIMLWPRAFPKKSFAPSL